MVATVSKAVSTRNLLRGALIAFVALLPLLFWYYLRPELPMQVPSHYTNGHADGFSSQQWLRDVAALPVVLYVALTLVPQMHAVGFSWWRSSRQRQLRAVIVTAASAIMLAILYRVAYLS